VQHSLDQRRADPFLQRPDVAADHRVIDAEDGGGAAHSSLATEYLESPQGGKRRPRLEASVRDRSTVVSAVSRHPQRSRSLKLDVIERLFSWEIYLRRVEDDTLSTPRLTGIYDLL